jgi:hypothetical protein
VLYQPQHAGARLRDRSFLTSDRTVIAAAFFVGAEGKLACISARAALFDFAFVQKKVARIVLVFQDARTR